MSASTRGVEMTGTSSSANSFTPLKSQVACIRAKLRDALQCKQQAEFEYQESSAAEKLYRWKLRRLSSTTKRTASKRVRAQIHKFNLNHERSSCHAGPLNAACCKSKDASDAPGHITDTSHKLVCQSNDPCHKNAIEMEVDDAASSSAGMVHDKLAQMSGSKSASAVLDSRLQQEIVGPTKCLKQTGSSSSTVSFSDQKTDIMEHLEVGQRPVQALEVAGDTKTPPDSSVIDQNSVEENLLDDLKMTSDADTKSHPTSALLVVRKTSNMKKSPPPYLIGSTVDLNVNNQKNPSQVASPTLTHSKEDLSGNMKLQPAVSQGIRSPVHLNDRDSHKVVKTSPDPTSAQPQTFRPSLLKACKTTTTPDATTDTSIAHSESMKKPAFSASAALKELQTSKPPAISPSSSKTSSLPAYALRQREWEEKMSYKPAIYIPQANVKYDWQMTSTSFATLNTTNEPTNFKYKPKTSQNARNSSSCDDQSVTTPEQTSQMGERISQPPKAPKLPPKDASEVVTTDKKTDDGCPSSPSVAKDSVDPLPVAINSKDDGGRPKTLKCAIVQQQQSKSEGKDNLLPTQHSPRCPSNSSNRILEDKGLSAGDGSTPPLANDACSHDHRVASKPIATTEPIPHATGTTTDERKSKASAFLSTNDSPEESVATKPSSVLCGEDRSKKRKADDQGIYGGQHRAFKRRTCRKLGMGNNSSMLLACCG